MQEFRLTGLITVTTFTTIKANSIEEAIEKANQRKGLMSIVSNNADSEKDCWMIGDLDGTPYNIHEEN